MAKTVNTKIQVRRDTSANWSSNNPVLASGEIGYDTTNKKIKIGDSVTAWNALSYLQDYKIFHGTCSTAGSVSAKEVTCAEFQMSDLAVGVIVYVTFDNKNTASGTGNLTMRVGSTAAKPIKCITGGQKMSLSSAGTIQANCTYQFSYDGTNWILDNTDSIPVLKNNYASITAGGVAIGPSTSSDSLTIVGSGPITVTGSTDNITITSDSAEDQLSFDGIYDETTNKIATMSSLSNYFNGHLSFDSSTGILTITLPDE